jgi:hypothetical protein
MTGGKTGQSPTRATTGLTAFFRPENGLKTADFGSKTGQPQVDVLHILQNSREP